METFAVYFRPRGSLASTVSSDTLFGAICWAVKLLGLQTDLAGWLTSPSGPPFAVSALFPVRFAGDRPVLRLFPKPINFEAIPSQLNNLSHELAQASSNNLKNVRIELAGVSKNLKRVQHVSEAVFNEIINARLNAVEAVRQLARPESNLRQYGSVLLQTAEARALEKMGLTLHIPASSQSPVQHNQIDRVAGATVEGMLYYDNETFFAQGSGLWALLRAHSSDVETLFRPAFRYLEDTGLGANRTVGKGQFTIHLEAFPEMPNADNPNGVLMLSRYLPDGEESFSSQGSPLAYRLVTLRPKREQKHPYPASNQGSLPVYKRSVRMFEAGSIFPLQTRREIYGRLAELVTLSEGGPVFQSGAAVPVFIRT